MADNLSKDEIALYDRQIRLWGMATQLRLRSAKILVINLSAVGSEVVKNLVLGGVNTLEILDSSVVKEEDFLAQFFLPNDDSIVGKLKLPEAISLVRELNNRVQVSINAEPFSQQLPEYFGQFDLIIATEMLKHDLLVLNSTTRALNVPLYASGMHGKFGYIFTDLIKHTSTLEKDLGNQSRTSGTILAPRKTIINVKYNQNSNKEEVTVEDIYVPLSDIFQSKALPLQLNKRQLKRLLPAVPILLALFDVERPKIPEDIANVVELTAKAEKVCDDLQIPKVVVDQQYISTLSQQYYTEFAPVSAILGGCLAQDVIQFLSKKESPINNLLILDGLRSEMPIFSL